MQSKWHKNLTGLIGLAAIVLIVSGCAIKPVQRQPAAYRKQKMMDKESAALIQPPASSSFIVRSRKADAQAQHGEPQERMLHHSGFLKLRTSRPRDLLDKAAGMVKQRGGFIEHMSAERAVFRVPVNRFSETFSELSTLGDILEKKVTSKDITDDYMDVDLRLKIARATYKQLMTLLGKAKTEKEKLKILKQIERVSETIEYLESRREYFKSLARYSRLTIEVTQNSAGPGPDSARLKAFEWIYRLSPFNTNVAAEGEPIKFDAPKDMVVLDQKNVWAAHSADGVFFRASRHKKQPAGSTAFWTEAVEKRLGPEFVSHETLNIGGFKLLKFKNRTEKPYIYIVGIHIAKNKSMELVEIYFPSPGHESRHIDAVMDVIRKDAK
ncbi:MAG: DUF4349 domain-containing protein [Desulfobacteraceae bacterium]|nr:DUF4349 domain-containing protein [Desulfobacteraceae bacterium]